MLFYKFEIQHEIHFRNKYVFRRLSLSAVFENHVTDIQTRKSLRKFNEFETS